jgi:hypothetical protein
MWGTIALLVFTRRGFDLELVNQVFGEGLLAAAFGGVVDGLAFLGEALEIGGGDLQAVEDGGAGFAVYGALQDGAEDDLDGHLERVSVLDDGHHDGVAGGVELEVEVAELVVADGRGLAGRAIGLDVAAAGGAIEFGNGHGYPYLGVMQTKGVDAGIPGIW